MAKHVFKPVDSKISFPALEQNILDYWKKNKTFEKSLNSRTNTPSWTFLDGPPFVTGMPHYGSLLSSITKDVFGRYFTMKGYFVRRVWGWDGHGLPIENKVEAKLGISRKKDIEEKVGVKKFIETCREYVEKVSGDWEWYIDHIGRWVDFKNAYKTWSLEYMESVLWVFATIYKKGFIYKSLRVSLYCPHCVTPISNFEVAMDNDNYKEITENATIYKFKRVGDTRTYFLAWSTTPWNKPVTTALAVAPDISYVKVRVQNESYILAKSTLPILKSEEYTIVDEFKGSDLIGERFEPLYDFFPVDKRKEAFIVTGGAFVSAESGTGIVTIAPYGEDDMKLLEKENIHVELHVDEEGVIRDTFKPFSGMYYLDANKKIDEELTARGLVYRIDPYTHSVPLCWRCQTRLYYAPQNAWFLDIQKLKPTMKKTNEQVNWVPAHFKYGRFLKSMEHAPDWCISRSRYWGSPVPVWECSCGERFVPASIAELEKRSGKKITDLHKPGIDDIVVACTQCGSQSRRVPEVLDSWIEAGSASFAERHYPFQQATLHDFFPPDFIAEYTGQIRAWFYVLHAISAALYQTNGFKNVLVTGVILGDDGKKMSKNLKNYPDPKKMIGMHGGDALRMYFLSSPVVLGGDIAISEEEYRNSVKDTLLIFWNAYKYFVLYANQHEFDKKTRESQHILDKWILLRLRSATEIVVSSLDAYESPRAARELQLLVSDLSTWYIRRSRNRFAAGNPEALSTLYNVLIQFSTLAAPLVPFITEEVYRNLTGEESVHLALYPKVQPLDHKAEQFLTDMKTIREIASLGHSERKKYKIGIRQPLLKATIHQYTVSGYKKDLEALIVHELNVKEVAWNTDTRNEKGVVLDMHLTTELKEEGEARNLIRKVQSLRKKQGCSLDEEILITAPAWPEKYEKYIKQKTLATDIRSGDVLSIKRQSRSY